MPNQIARLRKKGFLDEAHARALNLMETQSDDIRVRRAYGWVLYDLTKKAIRDSDAPAALTYYETYENLALTPEDVMLHENFARLRPKAKPDSPILVEAMEAKNAGDHMAALHKIREAYAQAEDPQYLAEEYTWAIFRVLKDYISEGKDKLELIAPLLDEYRTIFRSRPALVHSQMLRLLLKIADVPIPMEAGGFYDMLGLLDWWNLDNLRSDDFKPFTTEVKGKEKIIQPMAATAYGTYSSLLIDRYEYAIRKGHETEANEYREKLNVFLEKVSEYYRVHPNYEWLPYYKLKMQVALRMSNEKMQQDLMAFVKKKKKDFWAWGLVGDYFLYTDPEMSLACYTKALSCKAFNEYLVRVRTKTALLLASKGMFNEAKTEIATIVKTYEQKEWKLPKEIKEIMEESWFEKARFFLTNQNLYRDYKYKAEELVFGKQPIHTCIVTRIDKERGIAFFVVNKEITGKITLKEFPKMDILPGSMFDVVIEKKFGPNKVVTIKAVRLMPATGTISEEIAKPFYGQLKINAKAGFGFVDTVYLHPDLINNNRLRHFQTVNGMAVIQFDPKKQQWGWSAVSVNA